MYGFPRARSPPIVCEQPIVERELAPSFHLCPFLWKSFLHFIQKIMQLRKAERKQARIKLAIQGSAGSGKTYGALLIASGLLGGDWRKIAVIDTENSSADLYAHLGPYNVLSLAPPFSPERYIKAIESCEAAGMEVIVIDSISHCWDYLLEYHGNLQGNSFTNWNKVTPRQKAFVDKILHSKAHVIATMRVKQDYVLNQKDGKVVPEKVGLKAVQRDGMDYEFTTVFDLDLHHNCKASKDRTGLFMDKPEFIITAETGSEILNWCVSGTSLDAMRKAILLCDNMDELTALYHSYTDHYEYLDQDFKAQKQNIISKHSLNAVIHPL